MVGGSQTTMTRGCSTPMPRFEGEEGQGVLIHSLVGVVW